MTQLASFRAFVAAAAAGSFAAAGRELGLSRDQVSKLVQGLEDRLGVRLFIRSTREVRLTDVGANFLERVRRGLAELEAAEAAVRIADTQPVGRLAIHAPLSWGVAVLSPACGELRKRFPDLRIQLTLSDQFSDPLPVDFDVVIRIAGRIESSAAVERIGIVKRALYAAPTYLSRRPAPATPEELDGHDCVHYEHLLTGGSWVLESGDQIRQVQVSGGFVSNTGLAVLAAVIGGDGIGILPDFLADAPESRGELVRVLPQWQPPQSFLHVLTHPQMRDAPKNRALMDYLRQQMAPAPPGSSGSVAD